MDRHSSESADSDYGQDIDLTLETSEEYIGKRIVIGITYVNRRGKVTAQRQFHGIVEAITDVVAIRLAHYDRLFTLPPVVRRAPPGTYRFRSTGEEVESPDLLCQWKVFSPNRHPASLERKWRTAQRRGARRRKRRSRRAAKIAARKPSASPAK